MQVNPAFIYWFAHYNMLGPCTRYRGKYVLNELFLAYNIRYRFVYPSYRLKQFTGFIITYLSALFFRKKNSIIVFQKTYTQGIYSTLLKILLRIRNKNTYYDIDDAYYIKFPPQTIQYFIKNVMVCITGSDCLSDYAKQLSKNNSKVFTLSSPILKQLNTRFIANEIFTVGWVGFYNYHKESLLQYLFPALMRIQFKIRIVLLGVVKEEHFQEISHYFSNHSWIDVIMPKNIDWLDENEFYTMVSKFDVGVSPLLDNEMNRAKSAFKLKQYLCCGIPVIGSSTGENSKIIHNGVNGFIANNADEFYERLIKIKEMDLNQRQLMHNNALKSSEEYEMENYCRRFLETIRSTME